MGRDSDLKDLKPSAELVDKMATIPAEGPWQTTPLAPLIEPDSIPPGDIRPSDTESVAPEHDSETEPVEEESEVDPCAVVSVVSERAVDHDQAPTADPTVKQWAQQTATTPIRSSVGPRRRERKLLGKLVIGLFIAVIILMGVIVFLLVYLFNSLDKQSELPPEAPVSTHVETQPLPPHAGPSPSPAKPSPPPVAVPIPVVPESVQLEESEIVSDNSEQIQKDQELALELEKEKQRVLAEEQQKQNEQQYEQSVATVEQLFSDMAGEKYAKPLTKNKHQSIEQLYKQMLKTPSAPFYAAVLKQSGVNWKADKGKAIIEYDRLWPVGMAAYNEAVKQIRTMRDMAKVAGIKNPPQIIQYNRWLVGWLLGTSGFYCQLRERFWYQEKSEVFSIDENDKKNFVKLRLERKAKILSWGYPKSPLYDYCEREIFLDLD